MHQHRTRPVSSAARPAPPAASGRRSPDDELRRISADLDLLLRDVASEPIGHSHREADRRIDVAERLADQLYAWARGGRPSRNPPILMDGNSAWF
jgi:hypothetical protein